MTPRPRRRGRRRDLRRREQGAQAAEGDLAQLACRATRSTPTRTCETYLGDGRDPKRVGVEWKSKGDARKAHRRRGEACRARVPHRPRLPRADGADERHGARARRRRRGLGRHAGADAHAARRRARRSAPRPSKVQGEPAVPRRRLRPARDGRSVGRRGADRQGGRPAGQDDPQPRGRPAGGHLPSDDRAAHRSRPRRERQDRRLAAPRGRRAGGRLRLPPGLQQGGEGPRRDLHDGRRAAVLRQGRRTGAPST